LILFAYLAVCLLLAAMETRMVYHPPFPRDATEQARIMGGEEVWFNAADGTRLHGWYFPLADSRRGIVYFHGNGEDADLNVDTAAEIRDRLQASVLIFDYRGYGHSAGSPYEDGVVSDGIAAQRWLAEQMGVQPQEVVLFGRSLGGAVAVAAAAELGAEAVVVHGTFANMVDIAAGRYPFVPVRALMRNPYRSQERIANYPGPFLQLHGTHDVVVPIDLARPLCAAAPCAAKRFVEVENGTHNGPLTDHCFETIADFLDSLPQ
jgi:fermentation-respiration switch protein FrsA (DUF1100 family)